MLKKLVNEAYCTLSITTTGPLLVKSGGATIIGPDMTPVLTYRDGKQEIFIPGSSLKGIFRSYVEKIACSLKQHVVCYPFAESSKNVIDRQQLHADYRPSCGQEITDLAKDKDIKLDNLTDFVYKHSCPTCRLFGSTGFIGRISIGDAYLSEGTDGATELRNGIGIDRFTGGVSHGANFDLEVVSSGVTFEADIYLRNFEIWQLGMLFVVLQDLEDELITIGSGRSRGLGRVKASISTKERPKRKGGFVTSTMRNSAEPADELWGLGRWLEHNDYGTWSDDKLKFTQTLARQPQGIREQRAFQGDDLAKLRTDCIDNFVTRIQHWPETLDFEHGKNLLASRQIAR